MHRAPFEGEPDDRARFEGLVASAGLSQRETTVFQLLLAGKTAGEVSEELFISKGAVRSHMSRIYDKFGVHSRQDFDALFADPAGAPSAEEARARGA